MPVCFFTYFLECLSELMSQHLTLAGKSLYWCVLPYQGLPFIS